jgi:GrpB-like predicted nucleotidyltransferase (UPF0157 family)
MESKGARSCPLPYLTRGDETSSAMTVEWFDEPKDDPPVVSDPDPSWSETARQWIERLHQALAPLDVGVEHVGSTAVPGLAAKPVIDLQVAVPALADEDAYRPALESLGLVSRTRAVDHRFFRPPAIAARTIHIPVCQQGSGWEREHILFRDFLRTHPEHRRRYERLKRTLAKSNEADRARYAAGKTKFISQTLSEAERSGWPSALRG